MVTEDRLKRIRASICLLPDPGYEVARELLEEIARLREGLRLITCESVNAEYMAQNILDGLPAYHDTMLVPNETPNEQAQGAGGGLIAGGSPGATGSAAQLTEKG